MDARTLDVRSRLPAALIGLAGFIGIGHWFDSSFYDTVTFGIGVGLFASATFVEPFFTRPQDALVNSLAGLIAFSAIDKAPQRGLWLAYAALLVCVLASAIAAVLIRDDTSVMKFAGR